MNNNQIKKEPEETYCPECGKPIKKSMVRILLVYPIYFLAGMGINLILTWLINILAWLNDWSMDFNSIFKSWSSLLWCIIGAVIWSGFILLWHNHMEIGIVKPNKEK